MSDDDVMMLMIDIHSAVAVEAKDPKNRAMSLCTEQQEACAKILGEMGITDKGDVLQAAASLFMVYSIPEPIENRIGYARKVLKEVKK